MVGSVSLRAFLMGSWAVSRALQYTRGGATGPSSFDGRVRSQSLRAPPADVSSVDTCVCVCVCVTARVSHF
jgi:hypothetical protein